MIINNETPEWNLELIKKEGTKLQVNDKVAYIWVPKEYDKIIINVSGGTDSAMLLWQILSHLEDNNRKLEKIICLTGVDLYRPTSEWHAREIFLAIQEKFPNYNMIHEVFKYYKEGEKRKYHVKYEQELREREGIWAMYHGRTANPSKEIQQSIDGMWQASSRPDERESHHEKNPSYQRWPTFGKRFMIMGVPWEYIDKKFIADLFEENLYMKNEIYPITASCISNSSADTNYWQKPCKTCWWCKERYWAFGSYDGGTQ